MHVKLVCRLINNTQPFRPPVNPTYYKGNEGIIGHWKFCNIKETHKEIQGNYLKGKGEHQRMVEENECLKKKVN